MASQSSKKRNGVFSILSSLMIQKVPTFGNKFFYSLGFLTMISFVLLLGTGIVMAVFGANWWLTNLIGMYFRSVHLWATQAFVLFVFLHLLVVLFTGGYKKPRQLTWVIGVLMLFVALAETEFGYVLRGDFSSQWRSLQGADFYNGSGLGHIVDTLNYKQMFGMHIALIPFVIIGLLLLHYTLVRVLGLGNPTRKNASPAPVVAADHRKLFIRGGVLAVLIFALAVVFPSPFLKPTTVKEVATTDATLMAKTLAAEFAKSSDTATYLDTIQPYTYDVTKVYIEGPYAQLLILHPEMKNQLAAFTSQPEAVQTEQLKTLTDYFDTDGAEQDKAPAGPATDVINSLVAMAASGLYEPAIAGSNDSVPAGDQTTYVVRFIADTGILEERATALNMTTEQYGMLREETTKNPVGAWWLAPIGVLNHTVLVGDENGDRDAAVIFGLLLILMVAFPYIPWVSDIPEKLRLYKLFQR